MAGIVGSEPTQIPLHFVFFFLLPSEKFPRFDSYKSPGSSEKIHSTTAKKGCEVSQKLLKWFLERARMHADFACESKLKDVFGAWVGYNVWEVI